MTNVRFLPTLVGLLVLVGTGVVHGVWTERWEKSGALEAAAARLERLPEDVGPWKGRPDELDAESLARAGARGHWVRRFTHEVTGQSVLVILLCGRPGRMSVHRPEHCYGSAGFELEAPPAHCTVRGGPDAAPAAFWTGVFTKPAAEGPVQLRIFWSWLAPAPADAGPAPGWQAAESPRVDFAHHPALFKLYAVRDLTDAAVPVEEDPCIDLLHRLAPRMADTLSRP